MKKILLAALIPAMLIVISCNNQSAEMERLKQKNDSLLNIGYQQDTTLISYVRAFNEIQSNLDSIKMREKIITQSTSGGGEIQPRVQDQINNDIQAIYMLLQKNRDIVAGLRAKLKKSDARIVELEAMIENLNKEIEGKNAEIQDLKKQLASLNVKVEDLSQQVGNLNQEVSNLSDENASKQKTINDKTAELNTAYYVTGTFKELKDKGIITKEGGLLGIGANKTVKNDFDKSHFTKVDVTKLEEVPIYKKSARLVTTHPASSYLLEKDGKKGISKLVITNPSDFWSASKYLVIIAE